MIIRPTNEKLKLTSGRGWRNGSFHRGYDYAPNLPYSPVTKPAIIYPTKYMGGVIYNRYEAKGFGNWVAIRWDDGSGTWIAHLYKHLANNGQRIDINTRIGIVGMSGLATGPHYHHEEHVVFDKLSTNYGFGYTERANILQPDDMKADLNILVKLKRDAGLLATYDKPAGSNVPVCYIAKGLQPWSTQIINGAYNQDGKTTVFFIPKHSQNGQDFSGYIHESDVESLEWKY